MEEKFVSASRAFFHYAVLALALAAGFFDAAAQTQQTDSSLSLTSLGFSGDAIQARFTCDGDNISPQLSWKAPPAGTQNFALIVTDKDSWIVHFVHWTIYNIPADKRELPEGIPKQEQLSDGSRQGKTDFDKVGYGGPCPHGKSIHHYGFVLYALDTKLSLPGGATAKEIQKAMNGHILEQNELVGRYQRSK